MLQFGNSQEAKAFLADKITAKAQREGVLLSATEEKMLYFSETHWTLPDMADVSARFNRECDQAEYERKIGALIRNFCAYGRKNDRNALESWEEALRLLRKEDHYILVLVDASKGTWGAAGFGSQTRFFKTLMIGLIAGCVALLITYLLLRVSALRR